MSDLNQCDHCGRVAGELFALEAKRHFYATQPEDPEYVCERCLDLVEAIDAGTPPPNPGDTT